MATAAASVAGAAPPTSVDTKAELGTTIPLTEPIPAPGVAELAPPAAPSSTRHALVPVRPPPTAAELRSALAATPIVMYTASWCGVCRQAKQFLNDNGLRYEEIDADQTPGGWDNVQRLTGHRGVPVIVVDGDVFSGMNPQGVMRSVARSMERRLGVTGITFNRG